MMRLLTFFILLVVLNSCNNEPKVPADIIPPKKMQQVLWDMVRADETVNIYASTDTTAGKPAFRTAYYQKVFQLHQISKDQFKKSFTYYQSHPDLLKIVIDSMYNQATRVPEVPKKDSTKIH